MSFEEKLAETIGQEAVKSTAVSREIAKQVTANKNVVDELVARIDVNVLAKELARQIVFLETNRAYTTANGVYTGTLKNAQRIAQERIAEQIINDTKSV